MSLSSRSSVFLPRLSLLLLLGSCVLLPQAAGQTTPQASPAQASPAQASPAPSSPAPARPTGAITVVQVVGRAELQDSTKVWRPVSGTPTLEGGLRTGAGRAVLGSSTGGRVIVGSGSKLRIYSQETDFQQGQFLMEGPVGVFVLGRHVVFGDRGRARIDLAENGSTQRVAVLSGSLRVSNGSKLSVLSGGQQINMKTMQVSPFKEDDPWYDAQFTGSGEARVEALRGNVQITPENAAPQPARIGSLLSEGSTLNCASDAWAEVGFTGGGYLRLTANSELKVLAIEKTNRGREVTLQLMKGSAWNVVQKGQGGYKISTPVVSTAVRGTKFRVDASGLVKVIEGQVALPSDNGTRVGAGQQKQQGQEIQPLQLDALDLLNEQLDAERAKPMTLKVSGRRASLREIALNIATLPDTVVTASLKDAVGAVVPVTLSGDPVGGQFKVQGANLPDGRYSLSVVAQRFGHQLNWSAPLVLDQTPPTLTASAETRGRVLTVTGVAQDQANPAGPLTLTIQSGAFRTTNTVLGAFRILLPTPPSRLPLDLELRDAAGNVSHVRLP